MDKQPGQQQGVAAPQYSPDGRFWWDGRQWVPVQQQPWPPGGPPRRRRGWPWFALGAVALLLVFGVCVAAVSGSGSKTVPSAQNKAQPSQAAPATAAAKTASSTPARNGSCSPRPCANDNYGWIVTISDVKYDAPSGNQFEQPEAGNVYVTMNVTFTNTTDQERHANPIEFVLLDGAGVKHAIGFMTACPIWEPVNLTPGASLGPKCLAFEATVGKPSGLTLVWTPTGFGGGYNIKLS